MNSAAVVGAGLVTAVGLVAFQKWYKERQEELNDECLPALEVRRAWLLVVALGVDAILVLC